VRQEKGRGSRRALSVADVRWVDQKSIPPPKSGLPDFGTFSPGEWISF